MSRADDFELRARMTLSDGGAAALDFHLPAEETAPDGRRGWRLVLDHTGPGPERTGSIADVAPLTTQFLQPGVPFDLRLVCRSKKDSTLFQVHLNGVLVQSYVVAEPSSGGTFRLDPEVVPGTELEIETLEYLTY